MPFHRCTINRADGTLVCEDVEISLEVSEGSTEVRWHGTLSVTHQTELSAGGTYSMTLDDGRSGEFRVRRNTLAGGEDRAVAVHGTGPLSQAAD